MGVRNFLIAGVSGSGKTSVCAELQRRGYHTVHGDRELAYQGDPETGTPINDPTREHSATFIYAHHIWHVDTVQALVANRDEALTFFRGSARNAPTFIDLFDGVFLLEVDADTMNRRIDERVAIDPTDWGGTQAERDVIARMYQANEDKPKNGIVIDATAPLPRVVDEILRQCTARTTR